jgi:hypothetical protein
MFFLRLTEDQSRDTCPRNKQLTDCERTKGLVFRGHRHRCPFFRRRPLLPRPTSFALPLCQLQLQRQQQLPIHHGSRSTTRPLPAAGIRQGDGKTAAQGFPHVSTVVVLRVSLSHSFALTHSLPHTHTHTHTYPLPMFLLFCRLQHVQYLGLPLL